MGGQKSKKRKADYHHDGAGAGGAAASMEEDTSRPSAVFTPSSSGRRYTLSVALPGSIIANAQTHDLKTLMAGQIARALAVFCVDEVVVFDDGQNHSFSTSTSSKNGSSNGNGYRQRATDGEPGYTGFADPCHFLAHVLAYLETPPHLRKRLFALHPDLRTAGTLPSVDMPHHMRAHERCRYREGVSLGPHTEDGQQRQRSKASEEKRKEGPWSAIDVGFQAPVLVHGEIPEWARVTVAFDGGDRAEAGVWFGANAQQQQQQQQQEQEEGEAVDPATPRTQGGYYWGYSVRSASSLSNVITECPYDGGYDLTWGTSERGRGLSEIAGGGSSVPEFNHMLVVFGGVAGLEAAAKADPELKKMEITKPEELFDYWVNLCPGQGSRTIRTEEAIWIGLMGLKDVVAERGIR